MSNQNFTYSFKYIIIGDSGVGKSCTLLNFIDDQIRESHEVTIGVEFGTKQISLKGTMIRLQIWDTAGQESYRSLVRSYYRSAIGALLVYDITNPESFHNLQKWIEEIRNSANNSIFFNPIKDIVTILCGNKVDLESQRKVTVEEGRNFASQNNLLFIETSARDGTNVRQAFEQSCWKILDKINRGDIDIATDESVKVGQLFEDKQNAKKELQKQADSKKLQAQEKQKQEGCC